MKASDLTRSPENSTEIDNVFREGNNRLGFTMF